ncbi:hypothetical protein ACTL32_13445 [Planococcus sp. FY231025]|uniref:hypothetical protein n=1 Tax=Planococcus sp. FY231025 TaxID=3455699 RepID=UPI003F91DB3C
MYQKLKLFSVSIIINSLIGYIFLGLKQEINWLEGIWRAIVLLFLFSLLRNQHEQQERITEVQKQVIFFLSLVIVIAGGIAYSEIYAR